jgi:hypothetical protein
MVSSRPACRIGDKFQKGSIGIAEIDADAGSACSMSLDRSQFDCDAMTPQMPDGIFDRPRPFEAQVASTWRNRKPCDRSGRQSGTVNIELCLSKAINPGRSSRHHLRPKDIMVEGVGSLPVRDVDNAVIELDRHGCSLPPRHCLSGKVSRAALQRIFPLTARRGMVGSAVDQGRC